MAPRKKRAASGKSAFTERLQAEAAAPVNTPLAIIQPITVQRGMMLKGEWTKADAVMPQNMRNDPLSVFINTMNFWGLMATGWCAIARASWGLD